MSISAADVKALRDRTNAPMMECKAALTESGGNMENAIDLPAEEVKNIQARAAGVRLPRADRVYVDDAKKVGGHRGDAL